MLPNEAVLPFKLKVPEPVEMMLPLMVAVLRVEVLSTLELMVRALTVPVVPLTWNKADEVEYPPMLKSLVISLGEITPFSICQKLMEEVVVQYGTPDEFTASTSPLLPIDKADKVLAADA